MDLSESSVTSHLAKFQEKLGKRLQSFKSPSNKDRRGTVLMKSDNLMQDDLI